jgi:hypothetical protein
MAFCSQEVIFLPQPAAMMQFDCGNEPMGCNLIREQSARSQE